MEVFVDACVYESFGYAQTRSGDPVLVACICDPFLNCVFGGGPADRE